MAWEEVSGANPNLTRFLDFLAKAEGGDWNTVVGGSQFKDFSQHPQVVGLRTSEGPSTAAGRYQITGTTYNDIAPKLGITDFSPESQNRIAIELIRRNGALEDVYSGNYENAINKLGRVWASLPSSPYSQPKRDWNFVAQNLKSEPQGGGGWEDVSPATSQGTTNTGGWEDVASAPKAAAPQQAPVTAPAAPKSATATPTPAPTEKSILDRIKGITLGDIGKATDFAVRGVADALTFGYADELAARLDTLVGGGQSGKKTYEEALAAQRQADAEGGLPRLAGQVVGGLVPVVKGVQAAQGASRLARAGAGAATGAIQGGLYGTGSADGTIEDRLTGGALGAATGAAVGGVLGGVLPATVTQKGNTLIKKAGGEEAARLDAEIIKDIQKLAENPNQRGNPITAVQLNAIENRYINDAQSALTTLGKADKKQDLGSLRAALQNRRSLTPDELSAVRGTTAGDAVADAIEKAQRARSLTQAMQSTGGILPLMREGVDLLPLPASAQRGLKAALGGRQTREVSAQKALKDAQAAGNVLERLGPSAASQSITNLQDLARTAQEQSVASSVLGQANRRATELRKSMAPAAEDMRQQYKVEQTLANKIAAGREKVTNLRATAENAATQKAANEAAAAAQKEQEALIKLGEEAIAKQQEQWRAFYGAGIGGTGNKINTGRLPKFDQARQEAINTIQKMAEGKGLAIPGGGSLRATMDRMQRDFGMTPEDTVSLITRLSNESDPAAKKVLSSLMANKEVPNLLSLQDAVLAPYARQSGSKLLGALSESAASSPSPVKNPIAYKANVDNAMEALSNATKTAPSPELAQFASSVAAIKTKEDKAAAIAARIAKATDPVEIDYLNKIVKPLADFGAKAKKQ